MESHHSLLPHKMHNALDHVPDQTVESKLENLSSMDCVAIDDSLSQDNTASCD